MTETLLAAPQPARAALCRCCGKTTNFEVPVGNLRPHGAIYCEGCADLPRPWYYDGDEVHVEERWNTRIDTTGYFPLGTATPEQIAEGLVATPTPAPGFVTENEPLPPDNEPPDATYPTCTSCGGSRFRAYVREQTRGWREGYSPITDTAEYSDLNDTVYIEDFVEDHFDEGTDVIDYSEVQHIECVNCGVLWNGEWESA